MKKVSFITAMMAMLTMATIPAFAQEDKGFKKIDVREDFTENGFMMQSYWLPATRKRAMP